MSRKKIARILLVLAVFASLTLTELTPLSMVQDASAVTQADIDKLKDELSGMNSEKSQLEKELKSIQNDKSAALAQKENIDKQINLLQSEIKGVESLISEYESLITQTEQEIRENEEEEARQYKKVLHARARHGGARDGVVLVGAVRLGELFRLAERHGLHQRDHGQRPEGHRRSACPARADRAEEGLARDLPCRAAERQGDARCQKKSELNTQRAEAEKVLAELKANEAQYKQVLSEKDAAMERQQAEIVRLSRELAEKNGNTTVTYGGYIWPCSSKYVTSPLGARYTGIAGASTNHAGIDIGRVGYTTQAVAAKAGTVIISAYNKYRGNYVVVSHGSGNTTTYQHLSSRSVSVGTYVAQGQVVGFDAVLRIARRGNACCTFGQARSKIPAKAPCELCRVSQGLSICGRYLRAVVSCRRPKSRCRHGKGGGDHPPRDGAARPLRRSGARIALCAPSQSAALEAAARELSKDVRYLHSARRMASAFARTRCAGTAARSPYQTDEDADERRFRRSPPICLVLPGERCGFVAYGRKNRRCSDDLNEDQLICANQARRAVFWVKDVKMPPDGENANLP